MPSLPSAVVVAPNGVEISWTAAESAAGAVLALLGPTAGPYPAAGAMWEYARANGYRLRFMHRKRGPKGD
jgi:hypothetical protein